ncbi:MAG: hypothetical protein RLY50_1198, partial [Actinomycetota bacterium]
DQTSYFNVVAWGTLGENVAASITKGMRVVVSGRLEQREYQTREGDKRQAIEINADEVGPSLRWATASVERTPRGEGGNFGGGSRGGNTGGGGGGNFGGGDAFPDEEPF